MFTLTQALDAIKNKPEFGHYQRENFSVIDYNLTTNTTFVGETPEQTHILRNLRGTCFDHSGKIIRLSFHKFENLGQSAEYMPELFDFSQPHRIEQKRDGSMITPLKSEGLLRLATRAGITDTSLMAEKFLSEQDSRIVDAYMNFMDDCVLLGYTPIFEFTSRQNRVVLDYPEASLTLLDVRCNVTGDYLPPNIVGEVSNWIPRVKVVANENSNIEQLAAYIKTLKDDEGVVVKFADGRYVKIKADEYCLRHRTLDGLRFEKDVLKIVLTGLLDDVLPMVPPDTAKRLQAYQDSVVGHLASHKHSMELLFSRLNHLTSKKDFAFEVKDSIYRNGLFAMFDRKEYSFVDHIVKQCGSSSGVESVRWLIGPSYYDFK